MGLACQTDPVDGLRPRRLRHVLLLSFLGHIGRHAQFGRNVGQLDDVDGHGERGFGFVAAGEERRDGRLLDVVRVAAQARHPVAEVLRHRLDVLVLRRRHRATVCRLLLAATSAIVRLRVPAVHVAQVLVLTGN